MKLYLQASPISWVYPLKWLIPLKKFSNSGSTATIVSSFPAIGFSQAQDGL
jgi:hypothetical protein